MPLHTAGDGLDPFLFHLISVGGSVVEASPGVEPAFEGVWDVVTGTGDADVSLSAVIGILMACVVLLMERRGDWEF